MLIRKTTHEAIVAELRADLETANASMKRIADHSRELQRNPEVAAATDLIGTVDFLKSELAHVRAVSDRYKRERDEAVKGEEYADRVQRELYETISGLRAELRLSWIRNARGHLVRHPSNVK